MVVKMPVHPPVVCGRGKKRKENKYNKLMIDVVVNNMVVMGNSGPDETRRT